MRLFRSLLPRRSARLFPTVASPEELVSVGRSRSGFRGPLAGATPEPVPAATAGAGSLEAGPVSAKGPALGRFFTDATDLSVACGAASSSADSFLRLPSKREDGCEPTRSRDEGVRDVLASGGVREELAGCGGELGVGVRDEWSKERGARVSPAPVAEAREVVRLDDAGVSRDDGAGVVRDEGTSFVRKLGFVSRVRVPIAVLALTAAFALVPMLEPWSLEVASALETAPALEATPGLEAAPVLEATALEAAPALGPAAELESAATLELAPALEPVLEAPLVVEAEVPFGSRRLWSRRANNSCGVCGSRA